MAREPEYLYQCWRCTRFSSVDARRCAESRCSATIVASGRTGAGVHARSFGAQVAGQPRPHHLYDRWQAEQDATPSLVQRYDLKADYPMVAPTYSENRRAMAHKIGLGRKAGEVIADAERRLRRPSGRARLPLRRPLKSISRPLSRLLRPCDPVSSFKSAAGSEAAQSQANVAFRHAPASNDGGIVLVLLRLANDGYSQGVLTLSLSMRLAPGNSYRPPSRDTALHQPLRAQWQGWSPLRPKLGRRSR